MCLPATGLCQPGIEQLWNPQARCTHDAAPPETFPLLCLQMWQGGWRCPDLRRPADGPNQAGPLPGTDCQGRRLLPDGKGNISYLLCEFLLHEGAHSSSGTLAEITATCARQAAALSGQAACGRDPHQLVAANMQAGVDCLLGELVRCTDEILLLGHLERNRPGPPVSTTLFGAGGASGAQGLQGQAPILPDMPPEDHLPRAGGSAPVIFWVIGTPVGQLLWGSCKQHSPCMSVLHAAALLPFSGILRHLIVSWCSPQWELEVGGKMLACIQQHVEEPRQ